MPAMRRRLVYAAVAAGAALVALGPIADGDIYWHPTRDTKPAFEG